jgi:hypothetical protein
MGEEIDWRYDGLTIEKLAPDADGNLYVAGYASNDQKDEDGEFMDMDALKGVFDQYMTNPVVKFMHDRAPQWKGGIGKVVKSYVDNEGNFHQTAFGEKPYLVIKLSRGLPGWMYEVIKDGTYKGLSIGGKLAKKVGSKLYVSSWLETSIVDVPSAKGSFINVLKAAEAAEENPLLALSTEFHGIEDALEKFNAVDSAAVISDWLGKGTISEADKEARKKKKEEEKAELLEKV